MTMPPLARWPTDAARAILASQAPVPAAAAAAATFVTQQSRPFSQIWMSPPQPSETTAPAVRGRLYSDENLASVLLAVEQANAHGMFVERGESHTLINSIRRDIARGSPLPPPPPKALHPILASPATPPPTSGVKKCPRKRSSHTRRKMTEDSEDSEVDSVHPPTKTFRKKLKVAVDRFIEDNRSQSVPPPPPPPPPTPAPTSASPAHKRYPTITRPPPFPSIAMSCPIPQSFGDVPAHSGSPAEFSQCNGDAATVTVSDSSMCVITPSVVTAPPVVISTIDCWGGNALDEYLAQNVASLSVASDPSDMCPCVELPTDSDDPDKTRLLPIHVPVDAMFDSIPWSSCTY